MNKLNLLVAYPYMKKDVIQKILEHKQDIRFLLDSGAFTAWKSGKPIALDDYCRFIESLPFEPWRYFSLDVIGDAKASMANYETMLKRGFKPIPIFTRGEDVSVLDDYYKTSDVVGIGGLVGTPKNKGFVKGIMKHVGSRKVHWLGFNAKEFIAHYKPFSCDSSSWSGAFRFGTTQLYKGNGVWIPIKKKDFHTKPNREILDLITSLGVDPNLLKNTQEWRNVKDENNYAAILLITCRNWVRYQQDIKLKLDVNFSLACGQLWEVATMIKSYNFWKERNESNYSS